MTNPELESQIADLLRQGQKLNAVKLYRETMGCSLHQAKVAVESFEAGEPFSAEPPPPVELDPLSEAELLSMLHKGEFLKAVKHYRELKGADLRTSKEAVERLAARHGIAMKTHGCGASLLLIAVTITAALTAAAVII